MDIKVDEISKLLRQQIEGYYRGTDLAEVDTILSVGDGIGRIYGLEKVMSGELLELPHGVMGMALNLEEDSVGAVLLGEGSLIKEGDQVRRTRKIMQVPVGDGFVVTRIPEELEFAPGMLEFLEEADVLPGREGVVTAASPDGTTTVEIAGRHVGIGSFASARILVTTP